MTINDLILNVKKHNITGVEEIEKAYNLAASLHEGQFRESGEPYIIHPLHVAYYLSDMYADKDVICAGLLHDTLEDTIITKDEIASLFNDTVANLVEGVSKFRGMNFSSRKEKEEANTSKILHAIDGDIRVVMIKCADRLHNMETIGFKKVFKQKENAIETMEIYVPLAAYTGMYQLKNKLEDHSFKVISPLLYNNLKEKIEELKSEKKDVLTDMTDNIKAKLKDNDITAQCNIRIKSVYSTYKKLLKYKELSAIYDLLALKIITDDYLDCYKTLGILHKEYKPLLGRFKDYIATPKTNFYQSLHTVSTLPDGTLVQGQIRTREMNLVDTYGLPAYLHLNQDRPFRSVQDEIRKRCQFCNSIRDISDYFKRNDEFINQVKTEIFTDKVYVYNKNGEFIEFPKGSTPIDFAYYLGDDFGNYLDKAVVNGVEVPLDYNLKNKDRVIVIADNNSCGPNKEWLDMAKTTRAKQKILEFKPR